MTRIKTVYTVWRIIGAGCQYYHAFIQYIYLFKIDETMLMTSFHFVAGTPRNQTRKTRLAQYRHSIVSAPHNEQQNTSASGTPCHPMQVKKSNHFSCTSVNDSSRPRATSHPNLDPRSELFVAIVLHLR